MNRASGLVLASLIVSGGALRSAPAENQTLTAVEGIKVGHHTLTERPTGCTVALVDGDGAVGGVSQRGGAPGTRETDLLDPLNMVDKVNAIVLAGGSAFGLDAATGTVKWLDEHNVGFDVRIAKVPIVPAAILFDLPIGGNPKIRPTADCGYRAAQAAASSPVAAYRLTWLIAAASSHDARFSSRCALAGDRSPACSPIVHPFREGSSLTSAFTYFPACSHVCVRAKHDRISPIRTDLSRSARRAPILASAAALYSFVSTNT